MAENIHSGKLDNRVTVTTYTQSTNEIGGQSAVASNTSIWADVSPMKGNRAMQYSQIVSGTPYDVVTRYFDGNGLSPGDTITFEGTILTIHSEIDRDRHFVRLAAVKRTT